MAVNGCPKFWILSIWHFKICKTTRNITDQSKLYFLPKCNIWKFFLIINEFHWLVERSNIIFYYCQTITRLEVGNVARTCQLACELVFSPNIFSFTKVLYLRDQNNWLHVYDCLRWRPQAARSKPSKIDPLLDPLYKSSIISAEQLRGLAAL